MGANVLAVATGLAAATGLIFSVQLPAGASAYASAEDAPVVDIVAPILDIELSTSDSKRQARLEEAPQRTKVTLDSTIAFGKDSATLHPTAITRLDEIAKQLGAKAKGTITVIGYTDDLGSAAHGQKLSDQRAKAVSAVLKKSLPASKFGFTVAGKGEADPAVPNDSEANRKINRRVEITYKPA